MLKILVTIVSHDRPGIIHEVCRILNEHKCSVQEVSQTTLLGEFAGLFSCALPQNTNMKDFEKQVGAAFHEAGLGYWINKSSAKENKTIAIPGEYEHYVVTLRGSDRAGVIATVTGTMAGFGVNVDNLRSITISADENGQERQVIMYFELSVPKDVNKKAFRQALILVSEDLGMEMSLSHRNIFEAIHRL